MTDLKNIQAAELEMLKALKAVCDSRHIPYFIAQGTLLGAVRHQGFIPWDDDIDVLVPYRKIPQLTACFQKEFSDKYTITNHHIEKYYPSTWTKIRKNNTTSMPVKYKDLPINWGICIDIFPFYDVSDNKLIRTLEVFLFKCGRKLLMASMTKFDKEKGFGTRLTEKLPLSLRRFMANVLISVFKCHKENSTKYVYLTCKGGKIIERSILYGDIKKLKFEDDEYCIPSDYHTFLTEMYGDYMTPPPIEEQGGHDLKMGDIIWDCNNDYTKYKL